MVLCYFIINYVWTICNIAGEMCDYFGLKGQIVMGYNVSYTCGVYVAMAMCAMSLIFGMAHCTESQGALTLEYKTINELRIVSSVEATLKNQEQVIGFLKYVKAPCIPLAVFYDF